MTKIIFLIASKFTKRDYDRFGLENFLNRGYKVEIWDFMPWVNRKYSSSFSHDFRLELIYTFKNRTISSKKLSELNNNDVIIDFYRILENYGLLKFVNSILGHARLGDVPTHFAKKSNIKILSSFLFKPYLTIRKIIEKINYLYFTQKHYDFLITGGEASKLVKKQHIFKKALIIDAHSFDYDQFLHKEKYKSKIKLMPKDYAVFLDECVPSHPDAIFLNESYACDASTYFSELGNFFKMIKENLNVNIAICAHPKANYKDENPFFGNKIFYGKTDELIKNSKFIICHASTAISFGVLYKKPLLFIDSSSYEKSFSDSINLMSSFFDSRPTKISSPIQKVKLPQINETLYDDYKCKFIKSRSSPKKKIWDIFFDNLEKILEKNSNLKVPNF